MTTDVGDDNLAEFDWDRLESWFADLCRRERVRHCLPAALWLVCTCDPPPCADRRPPAGYLSPLADLAPVFKETAQWIADGQPLARPIQNQGPPTWRMFAESLIGMLELEPAWFPGWLCLTIDLLRQIGPHMALDEPAASEIRALLDYHDLYHPDLLPAVRRMVASLPAAREVLGRWQPSHLSPEQKIVRKMGRFVFDALRAAERNPDLLAGLAAEVSRWSRQLVLAAGNYPDDLLLVDLPPDALHQVEQIIDNPALSILGKFTAIHEVIVLGAQGKVVSH